MKIKRSSFATWSKRLQGKDSGSRQARLEDSAVVATACKAEKVAPGRIQRKESQPLSAAATVATDDTTTNVGGREPIEIDHIKRVAAAVADDAARDPAARAEPILRLIAHEVNNPRPASNAMEGQQEQRDDVFSETESDFQSVAPSPTNDSILEWMSNLGEHNEDEKIKEPREYDGRDDDVVESYSFLFSDEASNSLAARHPDAEEEKQEIVRGDSYEQRQPCPPSSMRHEEETLLLVEENSETYRIPEPVSAQIVSEAYHLAHQPNSVLLTQNNSASSSESSGTSSDSVVEDIGYLPIKEDNNEAISIEEIGEKQEPQLAAEGAPMSEEDVVIAQFSMHADDMPSDEASNGSNVVHGDYDGATDDMDEAVTNPPEDFDASILEGCLVEEKDSSVQVDGLVSLETPVPAHSIGDEEFLQGQSEDGLVVDTNIVRSQQKTEEQPSVAPSVKDETKYPMSGDSMMDDHNGKKDAEQGDGEEVTTTRAAGPTSREFSKPKISSWGRKKRLKKHEQIKEKQIASNGANDGTGSAVGAVANSGRGESQSVQQHTKPTQDKSPLTLRKITMKNKARQERIGRVKLRSSLVGVGEIFSTADACSKEKCGGSLAIAPIKAKSAVEQVPFKADQSVQETDPDDPDMSDMIWWSGEKDAVEIVAVKSNGGFASAWKEQEDRNEMDGSVTEEDDVVEGSVSEEDDVVEGSVSEEDDVVEGSVSEEDEDDNTGKKQAQRREQRRAKKEQRKLKKAKRREIALAASASDLSGEMEQCACREVIDEGPILCHAMANEEEEVDAESSGCRAITYDLTDMAKEFITNGPAVVLRWLE